MKFILTAGGTGGHIYPALAVLDEIKKNKGNKYLYIGTKNRMENDLIPSMGIPYKGIDIYILFFASLHNSLMDAKLRSVFNAWFFSPME